MGDVVHVSLPDVGDELSVGDTLASIESVKAASDVYVPVDCVVNEVNGELDGNPGLVNESPEADGWFAKVSVKDASALADMMDEAAYRAFCEQH
ncbi:gcvH [Symbiodinium sp. KB8]|nr:gcvH [Symbiodinium sp. KB8]